MISPPNPSPTSRNSPTSPRRRHGLGGLPRRENLITNQLMKDLNSSNEYERGTYDLKKVVEYAKKKDYTSLIVVHTTRREPDTLLIIGLPNGPAAHFKLSNLVLRKDIKNHGNPTSHEQELVLNNFTTSLGNRVGSYIFDIKEDKQSGAKGKEGVAKERVKDALLIDPALLEDTNNKTEAICRQICRSFTEEKPHRLRKPPPEFRREKPIRKSNVRRRSEKLEKRRRGETTTITKTRTEKSPDLKNTKEKDKPQIKEIPVVSFCSKARPYVTPRHRWTSTASPLDQNGTTAMDLLESNEET
ncbi:unnamed protein product [Brassica oleracea]|uniref:(rape) hypothetical protein n=1 Tax=Brassica napus TaxID=3708 RepID=A0A816L8Y8_BRANA|nr:unnamed protein product [Brassica napus]